MITKSLLNVFLLVLCSWYSLAVNILVLQEVASPSHQHWLSRVTNALALKGYNVTVLSPDIEQNAVANLHYLHLDKVYDRLYNSDDMDMNLLDFGKLSPWFHFGPLFEYYWNTCEGAVVSSGWKQLRDYPSDFKFDLVIHDFSGGTCHLSFMPKFKYPPLISLTAFNDVAVAISMMNTVLTPSTSTHFSFKSMKTSLLGRIENYLMQVIDYTLLSHYFYPRIDEILREKGNLSGLPAMASIGKLSKLAMINYDPAIDTPEQLPPNVIGVGGLQIQPVKPLPQDFKRIVDNVDKGLIVFSLGTNIQISTVGAQRITHILEAFRKIPDYTFLCKFELENPPVPIPANVFLRKWIPQNDVLGHKNTKLFITHAGLLGTQEATFHGVPMLGIPTFLDQFLNNDKSVRKGIAERIHWDDLTADHLYEKITKVLTDPSYAANMKAVSRAFRDQKEAPLDRAVWWIEWSLRNPNATHYRSVGSNFNFIQLQSLDVIGVLFLFVLFGLWVVKKIIFFIFRVIKTVIFGKSYEYGKSKPKNKNE